MSNQLTLHWPQPASGRLQPAWMNLGSHSTPRTQVSKTVRNFCCYSLWQPKRTQDHSRSCISSISCCSCYWDQPDTTSRECCRCGRSLCPPGVSSKSGTSSGVSCHSQVSSGGDLGEAPPSSECAGTALRRFSSRRSTPLLHLLTCGWHKDLRHPAGIVCLAVPQSHVECQNCILINLS